MVSLRNDLPILRGASVFVGRLLLLIGLGLIGLTFTGWTLDASSRHTMPQPDSLRQYVAAIRGGAEFDVTEATRRIYLGTTHSDDRRIALTENWLHWTLGQIHPPLSRTQDAERLIVGNLANCSERSQILKELVEEAGYDCRFVGLSGHVVLEVNTSGGWQIADPDYGVVYPLGIAALEQRTSRPLIVSTLGEAGFPRPTIERYVAIVHSIEDNVVLPVGSPLSPRLAMVERACQWLVWLFPAGCVLIFVATHVRFRWPVEAHGSRSTPARAGQLSQAAS